MTDENLLIGIVIFLIIVGIAVIAYVMIDRDDSNTTTCPSCPACPAPPACPDPPPCPAPPPCPTQYVYEFIKNVETAHTHQYNLHITDIRADGVRITSSQIQLHTEPEWAKCNSKPGGYECEGDNYGLNDPEPANPTYGDLSWSAWREGQIPVGSKVFTITTTSKVKEFEIDYFRPKYQPGWIIKENGKEVLKEATNGGDTETPNPKTVKYAIP